MRIEIASLTRRGLLTACSLAACSFGVPTRPARAIVDGIPLYAPGDKFQLPEYGFETQLPQLEQIRDVTLPAMRESIRRADWASARSSFSMDFERQLYILGSTASILGDEAYTAVMLKARYAAAGKKLQAKLAVTEPREEEVLGTVDELDATVNEYIALVPAVVVDAVRARERKLAGGSPPAAAAPTGVASQAIAPAPQSTSGGLLIAPSRQAPVCGVDIRC